MSRFTLLFTLILLLAFLALPVLAQDAEETAVAEVPVEDGAVIETPAGDVIVAPGAGSLLDNFKVQFAAFIAIVITAVWNLIYIPVAAPIVELLTSVSKRLPALNTVSSPIITFFFTVVAWVAFVVMTQLGFGDRFDTLITGLTTIATAIFGIPVTQATASSIHNYAQKNNVPVLGYSRTPNAQRAMMNLVEQAIRDALAKPLGTNSSTGEKPLSPIAEGAGAYEHRG